MERLSVERAGSPEHFHGKTHHLGLSSWRLCEAVSALFAFAGWVTATLDYEFRYSHLRNEDNCMQMQMGNTLRWLDLMLSISALFFLVLRHRAKYMWNSHKTGKQMRFRALIRLFLESILLCFFPYPYLEGKVYIHERHLSPISFTFKLRDVCYTGSEMLYSLMFVRFFFVFRAIVNMSVFMDGHAKRLCRQYGVRANMRFTLRSLSNSQPLFLLIVLMIPPALLASQLIRLFERPYVTYCLKDFSAYTNSVYFTFVAMTTIAYGDFFPCTELGRVSSVLIEVWGMGLFSMMIYIIDRTIRANRQQERAFRALYRTRMAVRLIEAWYIRCKKHGNAAERLLFIRKAEYKMSKSRLLTVRTIKTAHRKEFQVLLEELEHSFTRIEIKAGTIGLLSTRLQGISQLIRTIAED